MSHTFTKEARDAIRRLDHEREDGVLGVLRCVEGSPLRGAPSLKRRDYRRQVRLAKGHEEVRP